MRINWIKVKKTTPIVFDKICKKFGNAQTTDIGGKNNVCYNLRSITNDDICALFDYYNLEIDSYVIESGGIYKAFDILERRLRKSKNNTIS